jgi:uncharacterized iron-regulated protein
MRLALAAAALAAATPAVGEHIDPSALDALPRADIVILGEVHDNPAHHQNQARAVAALQPAALVFEMLTPEQARRATADSRTDRDALESALGWAGSGWPDFGMYFPIFAAAPDARIHGAAIPRQELMAVVESGPNAILFDTDIVRWGLADALPAAVQADREARQHQAHCEALPAEMLPGMVMAQRVRDVVLAQTAEGAVIDSEAEGATGPVVIITGNGHAETRFGIPAVLDHARPDLSVLSIGQLEADPGPEAPFDLWIVTDPVDRPDPCAAFAGQQDSGR